MQRVVVVHDGTPREMEYLKYTVWLDEGNTRIGQEMWLSLSVEPVVDTPIRVQGLAMQMQTVSAPCVIRYTIFFALLSVTHHTLPGWIVVDNAGLGNNSLHSP